MIDEGYTKYSVDWTRTPLSPDPVFDELDNARRRLLDAGLIGHDDVHDVGFGNISVRTADQFIISGTQTGHLASTTHEHYARVTSANVEQNRVSCTGAVQASSESMTHAAIYAAAPAVGAIVHVHDQRLWETSLDRLPATGPEIAYGTPAMAHELERLLDETPFLDDGLAVMAGHDGGLIAIGRDLDEAAERMLAYQSANSV